MWLRHFFASCERVAISHCDGICASRCSIIQHFGLFTRGLLAKGLIIDSTHQFSLDTSAWWRSRWSAAATELAARWSPSLSTSSYPRDGGSPESSRFYHCKRLRNPKECRWPSGGIHAFRVEPLRYMAKCLRMRKWKTINSKCSLRHCDKEVKRKMMSLGRDKNGPWEKNGKRLDHITASKSSYFNHKIWWF